MGLKTSTINIAIIAIVVLTVLLSAYSVIVPQAQSGGDSISTTACSERGCFYNSSDEVCNLLNVSGDATGTGNCAIGEVPLQGLFRTEGVVFIIVMAAIVIMVVKSFMGKK